jgi:hypothetical protein
MMSENEKRETLADIEAELRELSRSGELATGASYCEPQPTVYGKPIGIYFSEIADRIEAAWKREREASEDETLVKSCNTCKHFQLKRKWCRVHDYSPCDPSKLPLIWPNGPCPQWECKYNSRGGVEK